MALLVVNACFLALPLAALAFLRDLRSAIAVGAVYAIAIACSPLPAHYVYSGALEIQGGVACGIFIASAMLVLQGREVRSRPALLAMLAGSAFLFPLYKDTIAPVVVAAALLAVLVRAAIDRSAPRWLSPRSPEMRTLLRFAAIPLAVSLLLTAFYNEVKYGTPLPAAYLALAKQTSPPVLTSAEFLAGSVLSPNGGILIFWFLPFLVAVLLLRWLGATFDRLSIAIAATVAMLSLLAFSLWWCPFGWDSWGDRLMIPPMLSLLLVVLLTADLDFGKGAPVLAGNAVLALPMLL